MNTDFNQFFSARKMSVYNINFQLSVLNAQNQYKQIIYYVDIFMPTVNLDPNATTMQ